MTGINWRSAMAGCVLAVVVLAVGAFGLAIVNRPSGAAPGWNGYGRGGMMGGYGADGYGPGGMMGGYGAGGPGGMMGGWYGGSAPAPGQPGFVAGTAASPRLVHVVAGPGYVFNPSSLTVKRGETILFAVTTMGPYVHEFMVGPAADVAADREGTPEVSGIGMMQTRTLTYTFDGAGPYAFACHAPGHYEAGMSGTIRVIE